MLELFDGYFRYIWDLIVSVKFPGTTLSIAAILLGSAGAAIGLKFLGKIMNVSFSMSSLTGQRGGNNKNINISDARKNDTR